MICGISSLKISTEMIFHVMLIMKMSKSTSLFDGLLFCGWLRRHSASSGLPRFSLKSYSYRKCIYNNTWCQMMAYNQVIEFCGQFWWDANTLPLIAVWRVTLPTSFFMRGVCRNMFYPPLDHYKPFVKASSSLALRCVMGPCGFFGNNFSEKSIVYIYLIFGIFLWYIHTEHVIFHKPFHFSVCVFRCDGISHRW